MAGLSRTEPTLVPLLGRLLLAGLFIWAGALKAAGPAGTIGHIAQAGLPVPTLAYGVALLVELGGGVLLVLGAFTRPVAIVLALWCVVTGVIFHLVPGGYPNLVNWYKNLSMAGGFLYVAAFGAGPWSVDALRRPNARVAAAA